MRRIFQIFAKLVGAVLLLGTPAALAYLQFVGFGKSWRTEVERALSGPTYDVTIAKLTFHPFEGIVAEDARVVRRDASRRRIAEVDRLVVSPNLADLLRGRVSVDQLDLEDTAVTIPFADDGVQPDAVQLVGIRAQIVNGSGHMTINRAECWLDGIHIDVRGQLLNPDHAAMKTVSHPGGQWKARPEILRGLLNFLRSLTHSGPAPQLDVEISGDLSKPAEIEARKIALRTAKIRYRDLDFERIALDASFADREFRLIGLNAAGATGDVRVSGAWNLDSKSGNVDVSGMISPVPILETANFAKRDSLPIFKSPPSIDASMSVQDAGGHWSISVTGHVASGAFEFRSLHAKNFTSAFAWKDGRLFIQDARLECRTGVVRADLMTAPGEFRMRLESEAMPAEFREFFGPKERDIVDLLEFRDVPKLSLQLSGTRPSLDALSGPGRIELGRSAMRGSWIDFATSDLVIKDRAIFYNGLTLGKGRLRAAGNFIYDFGRHEVRLENIRSNLNPPDVLMWVDPRVAETVAIYRFRSPPDVRADGRVHMEDPRQNDLRVDVDAPGGLLYELLNHDLPFGATQAAIRLKGRRVLADVGSAKLFGGKVKVNADVSIDPADPTFGAAVTIDNVDFPSLTNLYFGYGKSEGSMRGRYEFKADLKNPVAMRGRGSVRVENGHVMAIPLFGPLSDIISTIIPGGGHESARLATADFTISDQKIRTENLDIQGAGFELFGAGDVGFPSGLLDLTVRINARGIPGLVLFPVSKLFEYVSTGTVSDPQWRPKIIPKEFFNLLGAGTKEPAARQQPPPMRSR